MNIYSIIAFLLAGTVFFVGVFTSTDNPMAFVDGHAALIVFGGTIAVAAISFQIDRIYMLLKVFYHRVVRGHKIEYSAVIEEVIALAEVYKNNSPDLADQVQKLNDRFLRECMELLLEGFLTSDELERVISTRAETMFNRYNDDAKKFKALGKFPPAMGLMGAVLGMIALLQTLGQPGAEANVGPAMAIAMVATLYGIAFANLVVLPIAENLVQGAAETRMKNLMIAKGMKLISEKKNKVILAEEMNSFLLPQERIDWKKAELKAAS